MGVQKRFVGRKFILSFILTILSIVFSATMGNAAEKKQVELDIGFNRPPETVLTGQSGQLDYYFPMVREISAKGNVTFRSSNPNILTINDTGSWQAKTPGQVTISYNIKLNKESEARFLESYSYSDVITESRSVLLINVVSNTSSVYRVYNPNSGEHFYTKNSFEKDSLIKSGWHNEGIAWKSYIEGVPVYRVYNPNAGDHHYTTNQNEVNNLVTKGWRDEGVAFYASSSKNEPVYRVYNPNAKAGAHHYTKNYFEKNSLVKVGWKYEGIGWYGL